YTLPTDMATWTYWDLLAAGWVWARSGQARYAVRVGSDQGFAEPLLTHAMEGAPAGADPFGPHVGMVQAAFFFAVLRELDIFHAANFEGLDRSPRTYPGLDAGETRELFDKGKVAAFAANQIDIALIMGNGHSLRRLVEKPEDVAFAPL